MLNSTQYVAPGLGDSFDADHQSSASVGGRTLPSHNVTLSCHPVSLADVSSRIVSWMLAVDCGALPHEGTQDLIEQIAREKLASSPSSCRGADEVLQGLAARGWVEERAIELVRTRYSSQPPVSTSYLSALELTLEVAARRENIVNDLSLRAASYGVELPKEILLNMLRADHEGCYLFADAVRNTEVLLCSFDGPSCDELARELLAYCLKRSDRSIKPEADRSIEPEADRSIEPEAANDFLTRTRRVSRFRTDEFNPKLVFDMAIERGWMCETDRRQVKQFISSKPNAAWPIMHALEALRTEINHRAQLLGKLQDKGTPIPESINLLKDVVSKAASSHFTRLVNDLKNS